MNPKKTIYDLVAELSDYQNIEDKTLPLLKSFLYSEHFAVQLCKENGIKTTTLNKCKNCGHITDTRLLSLSEIITKLIEEKVISQDSFEIFNLLNKLRNRLIHDISPDTQKIIEWIGNFDPPTNSAVKDLLKKANSWLRFYLCLIPAIATLYGKTKDAQIQLDSVEYNTLTRNWIFHFK
ncbi:MAG TPA: hypothetical protein P5230_02050 [Candidatus Magasanikbacteria bacterium]|nr:hypothetical protein [Candidatus Magasanikbacteria bacterium]